MGTFWADDDDPPLESGVPGLARCAGTKYGVSGNALISTWERSVIRDEPILGFRSMVALMMVVRLWPQTVSLLFNDNTLRH